MEPKLLTYLDFIAKEKVIGCVVDIVYTPISGRRGLPGPDPDLELVIHPRNYTSLIPQLIPHENASPADSGIGVKQHRFQFHAR